MRWIGSSVALGMLVVVPARANDIYTWRDQRGISHYSNAPVPGARQVDLYDGAIESAPADAPPPTATAAATDDDGTPTVDAAAPLSDDERASFSTGASLRRQALERSYRAARQRLTEIDRSLTDLARFRVQHASEGTNAQGYQSDEEKNLADEKAGLEHELDQSRRDYDALQHEVVARLGAVPDWWIALP